MRNPLFVIGRKIRRMTSEQVRTLALILLVLTTTLSLAFVYSQNGSLRELVSSNRQERIASEKRTHDQLVAIQKVLKDELLQAEQNNQRKTVAELNELLKKIQILLDRPATAVVVTKPGPTTTQQVVVVTRGKSNSSPPPSPSPSPSCKRTLFRRCK